MQVRYSGYRYILCLVILVASFATVFGRLWHLHVVRADQLAAQAEGNRRTLIAEQGKRGNIYDRSGNMLAGTRTRIEVGLDPWSVTAADTTRWTALAAVLGVPLADIEAAAARKFRPTSDPVATPRPQRWVVLATTDEDTFDQVRALRLKSVYGNRRYERHYPGGELAAHLLGYLNKEMTAVMGVELAHDFYLRGERGWRESELDGRRREMAFFRSREVAPRNGLHVELTIDLYVQAVVEEALAQLDADYKPAGATVIVSRPDSGEILGLGNYPAFDPNRFWDFPLEAQRNRAVTDVYEPGSTFKIVPVAAALHEGLVRPDTRIDCGDAVVIYRDRPIRMPSDTSRLGDIPLTEVVAKSSNRGAALIGMMLGEQRMFDYSRRFGFGQPTGWPLAGEVRGRLHALKDWDGLTISRLPTGYALNATPLQVHQAMAAVANHGVLRRPQLVRRIHDEAGATVIEFEPQPGQRVVGELAADRMAEMLGGVVRHGTARRADIPGYEIAGKTGTSRKLVNGQYSAQHHIASFSGFFPASDPQLVITIMVDEPQMAGPGYGGVVAAPVFQKIASQLIPHLAIRKPTSGAPLLAGQP
jgi:cell division protein FtsI/penicillin-binding protein 2